MIRTKWHLLQSDREIRPSESVLKGTLVSLCQPIRIVDKCILSELKNRRFRQFEIHFENYFWRWNLLAPHMSKFKNRLLFYSDTSLPNIDYVWKLSPYSSKTDKNFPIQPLESRPSSKFWKRHLKLRTGKSHQNRSVNGPKLMANR